VPWSIVSGVRSSCDAVETKARRAASWRRSSSCMRASARARSPTSSRPVSRGAGASGPSALIRSATARRRASRRSSVLDSITPSPTAASRPIAAAASSALRTCSTAAVTSVSRRWATSTPFAPPSTLVSGSATVTRSPATRTTVRCSRRASSAASVASGVAARKSESKKKSGTLLPSGSSASTSTRTSIRCCSSNAALLICENRDRTSFRTGGSGSPSSGGGISGRSASTNCWRVPSTVSRRSSMLCVRSLSCSGPSSTVAATTSVSALVTTNAASRRPRRPRGIRRPISSPGSGTRGPAP